MSLIRQKSGKIIAFFVAVLMFVGYQVQLLPTGEYFVLIISCPALIVCGYYYDRSQKLEGSVYELNAHFVNIESTYLTNLDYSTSHEVGPVKEYKHRLVSIVEETTDYVGIAELSGRYVYMNRSFRNVLGLGDVYPNDIYMFEWHSENNRTKLMDIALPTAVKEGLWTGESSLLTKTGEVIPVILTIFAHKDQKGMIGYYSTTIRQSSTIHNEEEAKLSRLLLRRTIQVQDHERQKLAQELHDGLGQSLYSIILAMQYLQGNAESDQKKQLIQQWIDELQKALSIVKLFALQLRPHTLDQLGLSPAIEQLINGTRALDNNLNVTFASNMEISRRLYEEIEICLYRIVQEALHNALKHSKASIVKIDLMYDHKTIKLSVMDNGSGFSRDKVKLGLGLLHMEERTYSLRGTIGIHSIDRVGTTIKVEIPLEEPAN